MLPTILGAALLLLPSDQASLRGSRLLPAASNAIAAGLGVRAATLDTATYSTVPPNGTATPLTYTFPTGVIQAGNQIRFELYGHISDTAASTVNVRLSVTQLTALIPVFFQPATQNTDVAFLIRGTVTFSQPGPPNRGVVTNQKAVQSYAGGAQSSLIVGAYITYTQTDPGLNTATRRGGDILSDTTTTPSTNLSVMATNNDANTTYLLGDQPIGISLGVTCLTCTMTIQGGYIEAL